MTSSNKNAAGAGGPGRGEEANQSHHNVRPAQEHVLILAHQDGFLQAFAHRHVQVRIVVVPAVTSAAVEILAERFVELGLPKPFRDVFYPGFVRATTLLRPLTAADLLERQASLATLAELESWRERWASLGGGGSEVAV